MLSIQLPKFLRQPAASIGVDLDESGIRIALLAHDDGGRGATGARVDATWMLPIRLIGDDGRVDRCALNRGASALTDLMRMTRVPRARCAVTLPTSGALTEVTPLAAPSTQDLREMLEWEAMDRLGLDRSDVMSGNVPLNADRGGGCGEFLLVAVRRATAIAVAEMLASAGLEPARMELAPLAILRLSIREGLPCHALLHIERSRACFMVVQRGHLRYQRIFRWHSDHASDAGSGELHAPAAPGWSEAAREVHAYLRQSERRTPGCWPGCIYVSGCGSVEPGLCEAVATECGIDTRAFGIGRAMRSASAPCQDLHCWAGAVAAAMSAVEPARAADGSHARRVA
ncbi:MAG: hypothetical protein FGM37_08835 [Phycisphaerales bacterium]|nr:hypothetical protein [Phycisphaerales bacterium]